MASHHPQRSAALDDSSQHLGCLDQVSKMENFAFAILLCVLARGYRAETANFNLAIWVRLLGLTLRRSVAAGKDLRWTNLGLHGI